MTDPLDEVYHGDPYLKKETLEHLGSLKQLTFENLRSLKKLTLENLRSDFLSIGSNLSKHI